MIINETLPLTNRPQRISIRTRMLTSGHNRESHPRKWRYSSLGKSGHEGQDDTIIDPCSQKENSRRGQPVQAGNTAARNPVFSVDVTYYPTMAR
jgi:hypothetical protein